MRNAVYVCRRKRLTTWQLLMPLTDKMDPIAQKVVNPLVDDFSDQSYFTRDVLLKRKCQLLKVVAEMFYKAPRVEHNLRVELYKYFMC